MVCSALHRDRHSAIGRRIGSWASRRWHGSGAQFQDDFFEGFAIGADGVQIHRFQIEAGGVSFLAMTGDAVLVEDRPGRCRRR